MNSVKSQKEGSRPNSSVIFSEASTHFRLISIRNLLTTSLYQNCKLVQTVSDVAINLRKLKHSILGCLGNNMRLPVSQFKFLPCHAICRSTIMNVCKMLNVLTDIASTILQKIGQLYLCREPVRNMACIAIHKCPIIGRVSFKNVNNKFRKKFF